MIVACGAASAVLDLDPAAGLVRAAGPFGRGDVLKTAAAVVEKEQARTALVMRYGLDDQDPRHRPNRCRIGRRPNRAGELIWNAESRIHLEAVEPDMDWTDLRRHCAIAGAKQGAVLDRPWNVTPRRQDQGQQGARP
jgi:hypothetical protein